MAQQGPVQVPALGLALELPLTPPEWESEQPHRGCTLWC